MKLIFNNFDLCTFFKEIFLGQNFFLNGDFNVSVILKGTLEKFKKKLMLKLENLKKIR